MWPLIAALRRAREEDQEFKATLGCDAGYRASLAYTRPCLKKAKGEKMKGGP